MAEQDIDELRQDAARQRDAISQDLEYVGDRVSPGRIVERRRAVVTARFQGARSSVFGSPDRTAPSNSSGSANAATDRASGAMDTLKAKSPDSAADFTEGNPIAAGLIGLGVGLLVATLIPESKEEQQVADQAQDHIDALAGDLGHSGREAADNVRPTAEQAVQDVKGSAQDSAKNVQSESQSAAENVKSKADDKRTEVQGDS